MNTESHDIDQKLKAFVGNESGFKVPHDYFSELDESISLRIHSKHEDIYISPLLNLNNESGFTCPNEYFETLSDYIQKQITAEKDSKTTLEENELKFAVPHGYFELSQTQILAKVAEKNSKQKVYKLPVKYRWIAAAAVIVICFSLAFWVQRNTVTTDEIALKPNQMAAPDLENVNESEIMEALNEVDLGDEIYTLALIDPEEVQTILPDLKKDTVKARQSNKEIEDYLIENIDEMEDI